MSNKVYVSTNDIIECINTNGSLSRINHMMLAKASVGESLTLYAIPRGGIPVSYIYAKYFDGTNYTFADELTPDVDVIIDDLIDSGTTIKRCLEIAPTAYVAVPINKLDDEKYKGKWVVFPWEGTKGENNDTSADDIIIRLLEYIGEDSTRGGLIETPKRVLKAWKNEWSKGYSQEPADVLKVFEDGADGCDQMVIVKDIPVYSHCEHHLAPFFGTATIAYIPNKKIVGLSKLSRVVDIFAHRLQVQERLTNQIADAINDNLDPVGVGVIVNCRHMCMESRGIRRSGTSTVTSALRGAIREDARARSEFMGLVK